MAQVTIDDPDVHDSGKKVDDRGRVYVGQELVGERVTIVVEREDADAE